MMQPPLQALCSGEALLVLSLWQQQYTAELRQGCHDRFESVTTQVSMTHLDYVDYVHKIGTTVYIDLRETGSGFSP